MSAPVVEPRHVLALFQLINVKFAPVTSSVLDVKGRSEQSGTPEAEMTLPADDQVIMHRDIEKVGCGHNPARSVAITGARHETAARVIMDQDHGGG